MQFHCAVAWCDFATRSSDISVSLLCRPGREGFVMGAAGSGPCQVSLWHGAGSGSTSLGTSALSQRSCIIPSQCQNTIYSYSQPQHAPVPVLSDSRWPAQTCEFNEWNVLFAEPSNKGTSFPSWLNALTQLGYWEHFSWNKSQWVFQII